MDRHDYCSVRRTAGLRLFQQAHALLPIRHSAIFPSLWCEYRPFIRAIKVNLKERGYQIVGMSREIHMSYHYGGKLNLAWVQSAGNGVTNINSYTVWKLNENLERNLMLTLWRPWPKWGTVVFKHLKGLICLDEFNAIRVNIHYKEVCLVRGVHDWDSHMIYNITKYQEMMDVFNCTK